MKLLSTPPRRVSTPPRRAPRQLFTHQTTLELFTFSPLLRQTLWGGERIIPFKHLSSSLQRVGESWEISGLAGQETPVDSGPHQGQTLTDLLRQYGPALVGDGVFRRYGDTFPLLVKFIDAARDLSVQVHPNDAVAHLHGHPRGKTEMWYIMDSAPHASILLGLREALTPESYTRRVSDHTLPSALRRIAVRSGEWYHVPAGLIHAICQGTFLLEIQQTCDLPSRISDYDRLDPQTRRPRPLHTALAAQAIDFALNNPSEPLPEGPEADAATSAPLPEAATPASASPSMPEGLPHYSVGQRPTIDIPQGLAGGLSHPTPRPNLEDTGAPVPLVRTPHFTTRLRQLHGPATLHYESLDSFVILIGLEGAARLTDPASGQTRVLTAGRTLLVPAAIRQLHTLGTLRLLEAYVAAI